MLKRCRRQNQRPAGGRQAPGVGLCSDVQERCASRTRFGKHGLKRLHGDFGFDVELVEVANLGALTNNTVTVSCKKSGSCINTTEMGL